MCRYRCLMVRVEKNTAQWEPPLGVLKLDKAYAAATLSNGLEFIRLDLPDGTRWVLGEGAIGAPVHGSSRSCQPREPPDPDLGPERK